MEGDPLVSILMTAFNREKFIGEAIQSVLDSTYTNFELIIVDDHSTDKTIDIARKFQEKDSRVRVYKNCEQLGDYPNRNKAASYATGKYLKYVDSDDYIYPLGLECMVNAMERSPEAGWGICSLTQNQYVNKPFPFMLTPHEAYQYNYLGPGNLFDKTPLSAIIKKEVFMNAGGFSKLRMVSDLELWHRLGQRYSVVLMMDGLVWYREHGDREMNDFALYSDLYEQIRVTYLVNENCPLSREEIKKVLSKRKLGHFHLLGYHFMKFNFSYSKQYFRLILLDYFAYRRFSKKKYFQLSLEIKS
jgi:glycosyltransferase involved in cell wall biosynthesis